MRGARARWRASGAPGGEAQWRGYRTLPPPIGAAAGAARDGGAGADRAYEAGCVLGRWGGWVGEERAREGAHAAAEGAQGGREGVRFFVSIIIIVIIISLPHGYKKPMVKKYTETQFVIVKSKV